MNVTSQKSVEWQNSLTALKESGIPGDPLGFPHQFRHHLMGRELG